MVKLEARAIMRAGGKAISKWNGVDRVLWGMACGFLAMVGLVGMILASARANADGNLSEQTQAAVTVASSCRLAAVVDIPHVTEIVASTYKADIGKTTFTATCNDANGFDIYAVGYTNTEFGRNDMLGASTGRTIPTGTATVGDDSAWAMKLTAVTGEAEPDITTGYDGYHAIPDDYAKVATYADSTMSVAEGSQFEATYGVYASSYQSPDTYNGKVKYTLVHPSDSSNAPCASTYTIVYNSNGGSGSMDTQTVCVDKQIAVLPNGFTPPTPVDEWQFGAWNTEADGSGYTYYGGQRVANLASSGGSVTLYAQWVPHYIQDLTRQTCANVASERGLTVVDKRDGNDYSVRYLQGACWMTQNLRLVDEVSAQYSNFSTYSTVDVCEGGDLTNGNTYDVPRCMDSGNVLNGVWYNYAAASAKTILGSGSVATETSEDICPAGWHLPNYDTTKPAGSINSLVGMSSIEETSFQPVASGYYYNRSHGMSSRGFWWSSKLDVSNSSFALMNNAFTTSSYSRGYGFSVRCVR